MDSKIFRSMSYGVYVAGTMDGERPTGCIVNSVMQITSSPATVAISVNHDNYTNGCISRSGLFSFSILAEDSDAGLIGTFGFQSGREANKFERVAYEMIAGVPVVKDSCGYVVCRVINTMETATHTVFLGEVIEGAVYDDSRKPMTYAYYHQVKKGTTPPKASSFVPSEKKEESKGPKWRCTVCGHVHEGENPPENAPSAVREKKNSKKSADIQGNKACKANGCNKPFVF